MSRRKTSYRPQPFESMKVAKDTSANIYSSMMLSPACKDLTLGQRSLYLHMKQRMYGQTNRTRPAPDDLSAFTFPREIWSNLFDLYARNNQSGFFRDRDALIKHGFIICAENGQNRCKASVYRYSDRWQLWTPEKGLEIQPYHMSASMLHRLRKDLDD